MAIFDQINIQKFYSCKFFQFLFTETLNSELDPDPTTQLGKMLDPVRIKSMRIHNPAAEAFTIQHIPDSVAGIRDILVRIRIHTSDYRIRLQILLSSSVTFNMATKKYNSFCLLVLR
jgi:hypothetical protein